MGVTALFTMEKNFYVLAATVLASLFSLVLSECPAAPCYQAACASLGEKCHCSGNETGIPVDQRPMIVYLTFDDAFTAIAEEQFYHDIFDGTYKNPNECAIRATHFITQSYTDYYWHYEGYRMFLDEIT